MVIDMMQLCQEWLRQCKGEQDRTAYFRGSRREKHHRGEVPFYHLYSCLLGRGPVTIIDVVPVLIFSICPLDGIFGGDTRIKCAREHRRGDTWLAGVGGSSGVTVYHRSSPTQVWHWYVAGKSHRIVDIINWYRLKCTRTRRSVGVWTFQPYGRGFDKG